MPSRCTKFTMSLEEFMFTTKLHVHRSSETILRARVDIRREERKEGDVKGNVLERVGYYEVIIVMGGLKFMSFRILSLSSKLCEGIN